jgi:hypothetical protein
MTIETKPQPPTTIGAKLPNTTDSSLLGDFDAYRAAQAAIQDTLWRLSDDGDQNAIQATNGGDA